MRANTQDSLSYYMHDGPRSFRFELSGRLNAEGAQRLKQDWRTASSVRNGKTLVVDLSFVTDVDDSGRELMREWLGQGAQFVAKSAEGQTLVESITGSPMNKTAEPDHGAYRPWMSLRAASGLISLAFLLAPSPVLAATLVTSPVSLAFGRYVASVESGAPFSESGEIAVDIEASLPSMDKRGHLVAIRHTGEYEVVRIEGDSTVKNQVIARYLTAQTQAEALPASSVAVTPANYNFRYVGSISMPASTASSASTVYVFDITPKRKREGLIQGQLYIDAETGIPVHQTGYVVKRPSVFVKRLAITRDQEVADGAPASRTTRVQIDTRIVGRAELMITERPLMADEIFERGKP